MASAGAHLTSTVSSRDDEGIRPSIFELLAQEGLTAALRPALKYAVRILAEKNPAKFGWLYGFGDEIYALLDLFVEHYYLKYYSASFAENFYGMKRVSLSGGNLPASARFKSLMFLVLLPYIKEKCEQMYERMSESHNPRTKLQRAFLAVYPYLHCLHDGAMFIFQLAYIFGESQFHSPWLRLAASRLLCLTEEDIRQQMAPPMQQPNKSTLHQMAQKVTSALATFLSGSLSVSVFFLHFLEWWYSSEQQSTAAAVTALPTPPAPKSTQNNSEMCPLCRRVRSNHTALAVSGYVFCYPCIYRHIQKAGRCPVTGYPATAEHLLKLYLPEQ